MNDQSMNFPKVEERHICRFFTKQKRKVLLFFFYGIGFFILDFMYMSGNLKSVYMSLIYHKNLTIDAVIKYIIVYIETKGNAFQATTILTSVIAVILPFIVNLRNDSKFGIKMGTILNMEIDRLKISLLGAVIVIICTTIGMVFTSIGVMLFVLINSFMFIMKILLISFGTKDSYIEIKKLIKKDFQSYLDFPDDRKDYSTITEIMFQNCKSVEFNDCIELLFQSIHEFDKNKKIQNKLTKFKFEIILKSVNGMKQNSNIKGMLVENTIFIIEHIMKKSEFNMVEKKKLAYCIMLNALFYQLDEGGRINFFNMMQGIFDKDEMYTLIVLYTLVIRSTNNLNKMKQFFMLLDNNIERSNINIKKDMPGVIYMMQEFYGSKDEDIPLDKMKMLLNKIKGKKGSLFDDITNTMKDGAYND